MSPVVKELRRRGVDAPILVTGQHRELLDQMLDVFGLQATWDLNLMSPNQSLPSLTARLLSGISQKIEETTPSAILAQGDTTTVFCAALSAFYAGIPFGHVEAGLRSGDLGSPFPEEGNRRLAGVLAKWHFAPTENARKALLAEGTAEDKIHVVGNTVIDSLLDMARQACHVLPNIQDLKPHERLVLVTLHRRENFGLPLRTIFSTIKGFALRHPEARLIYPVHPNPNVKGPALAMLGGVTNIQLVEPLDYSTMVGLLQKAFLVLTDSGGLQEEAPALGKPVLVFRDVTERPEAVDAGGVILVGSSPESFNKEAERLWNDDMHYAQMARPRFPYGDGQSSERIADVLINDLSLPPTTPCES